MKNLRDYGFNTDSKVFTIAEIGINHGGDENLAMELIESASRTGVDAVKFQTYITEKRVTKDSPIFEILKKCEFPFQVFGRLNEFARELGLDFFSTPFDVESLLCLEELDVSMHKISSFDVVNLQFLKKIAETQKAIIMSVGMADSAEIQNAYKILKAETNKIALLHCISAYPTKQSDANLSVIQKLIDEYDCIIGHSDHTDGIKVPLYAVASGAQVIEKHYKINDLMDCVDSPVSITENQMQELILEIKVLEEIFGDDSLKLHESEHGATQFRRPKN
jgi:N,N'-diacetyllegionaminate synthase